MRAGPFLEASRSLELGPRLQVLESAQRPPSRKRQLRAGRSAEAQRTGATVLLPLPFLTGVPALFSTSLMQLSPDDFHYRIDLWDDQDRFIEQVIAFVSD